MRPSADRYTPAMDVLDAIGRVRTVRNYTPDPIDPADLRRIVDAGRHAGSSKNLQRWAFVTVTDRSTLERLATTSPTGGHLATAAAAIALVSPVMAPGVPLSVMWALGRAGQNLVLAAWSLGIGSCPVTVYEQALLHEILDLPDDRHCEYILGLGHPADPTDLTRPPRPGGRVHLDDILHVERW